ncbi:hypothetical protein Q8A67_004224 [Cirrhinus molitorella]|uniref:Uncharacterized protein n=1 Tax=Cirrhinus molitorella TaxID=172907 RepID=A0AA88TX25_9TELE|nr:hypothetical protein Q8A67_004224 [Cirrhinus molitorella]
MPLDSGSPNPLHFPRLSSEYSFLPLIRWICKFNMELSISHIEIFCGQRNWPSLHPKPDSILPPGVG